ncbi:MAG: fatty acid desaturase [Deltaproteobacteria bacterium]|nr:fatty acid desaturase [Deltaproteobacteria bacterium]
MQALRDPDDERRRAQDLRALRPPAFTAALNLSLLTIFLASIPLSFLALDRHPRLAAVLTPWMVFAFTGLFILAHEAIHGTLVPGRPRLGHALGRLAAFAYAFMDYGRLRARHAQHHAAPQSPDDPDAHASGRFLPHLFAFALRYLRWWQVALLVLVGNRVGQAGHTFAMLFAYVLPVVCSTLVVFSLGIFLVHHPRLAQRGLADARHRTVAIDPGLLPSLLSILFFNYHWLHHEHPHLTWLSLGRLRVREPLRISLTQALRELRATARDPAPASLPPAPGSSGGSA